MRNLMLVGVMVVILILATVGCAAGSGKPQPVTTRPAATTAAQTYTSPAGYSGYTSAPTLTPTNSVGNADWDAVYISQQIQPVERMVVRNGNIQMVVDDIAATMDNVTQIAAKYNGYVVSSQKWKEGDRNIGNISIRIESASYNQALADLRAQAKSVTNETTSSQDVTEEYVDLDAKVRNLEATETQLLKVMETAIETEDILSIQRELTTVRGEIEQAKGRMQYLQRTSATSLIEVRLEEAVIAVKFTAGHVSANSEETIHFTSEVTGGFSPYSYLWDFGDGQTSTESSPSHTYKYAGTYPVVLKVTDDKGYTNTMSRTDYIHIVSSWKPSNVASNAWSGLSTFGRALVNVLIWVGIFSPVWITIGLIIWFIAYRRRRKSRISST